MTDLFVTPEDLGGPERLQLLEYRRSRNAPRIDPAGELSTLLTAYREIGVTSGGRTYRDPEVTKRFRKMLAEVGDYSERRADSWTFDPEQMHVNRAASYEAYKLAHPDMAEVFQSDDSDPDRRPPAYAPTKAPNAYVSPTSRLMVWMALAYMGVLAAFIFAVLVWPGAS